MRMITVEFQSPTDKGLNIGPYSFDPAWDANSSDPFRVRHLIEKLVAEAVRDLHLRESSRAFELLTSEKIEAGLLKGKIGTAREEAQRVDVDQAVAQALQAFEDGLYLLFVDQVEKRSLEDIVRLQPETIVTVIRLTALAGG
jgi:hypothetical protein